MYYTLHDGPAIGGQFQVLCDDSDLLEYLQENAEHGCTVTSFANKESAEQSLTKQQALDSGFVTQEALSAWRSLTRLSIAEPDIATLSTSSLLDALRNEYPWLDGPHNQGWRRGDES